MLWISLMFRIVHSLLRSATQLNISALTQGVYYVKINSAGQYTTLKLIKR